MLTGELPRRVRPAQLVGRSINGTLSLERLPRLAEYAAGGSLSASLAFAEDQAQRYLLVTGEVRAVLRLPCQRCLTEMDWSFETNVQWGLAGDDAVAAHLSKTLDLDPVLLERDGTLDLEESLSDEVLLGAPMDAMHSTACSDTALWRSGDVA